MTEKTINLEVEVTGVPLACEQFEHQVRKLASEGERKGVDVTITKVDPESEHTEGFGE